MRTSPIPESSGPLSLGQCLQEFDLIFPTEAACLEGIRKFIELNRTCTACGNELSCQPSGARVIKCQSCSRKYSLTAGTFFHRIRRVRPWLAIIFLIERGVAFNSFQLHKLLGVAYSSALSMYKKLTVLIESRLQEEDAIRLPSALFLSLFRKRSLETPANKKPVAEEETEEPGSSLETDSQEPALEESLADPVEKAIYACLTLKPTSFDTICERLNLPIGQMSATLTLMELSGVVLRLPGDRYVVSQPNKKAKSEEDLCKEPSQKELVDKVIAFVLRTFQGISRKYLQNYIYGYWCHADRKRWNVGSLLDLCLNSQAVTQQELLCCVTPRLVQIPLVKS